MSKPLAIDLFCGLGGWSEALIAEGWYVVGFDINAMNSGGWIEVNDWAGSLVPWLLSECEPKANGRWHLTHAIEVAR